MQMLIDDLLLLARLDEGRPLASEPVDLVAVLDDAVDAARAVGPEWPITSTRSPPVEVIGDPMRCARSSTTCSPTCGPHTPAGTPHGRVRAGRGRAAGACSRSPTAVPASTPRTRSGCSSASTAWTRRAPGCAVGVVSGSRWSPRSSRRTRVGSRSSRRPGRARRSASACRSRRLVDPEPSPGSESAPARPGSLARRTSEPRRALLAVRGEALRGVGPPKP